MPPQNPTRQALFPALCPSTPTSPLERIAYVRDRVLSTFVVPGDWVPEPEANLRVQGYSHGAMLGETSDIQDNDVQFFISGSSAYASISEDLEDAKRAGAAGFVGNIGWTCYLGTIFTPRRNYQTVMHELLTQGVMTRALYWVGSMIAAAADQTALQDTATALNRMSPTPVAFLDAQTKTFGSHHQKIWVILGRGGLTAYFGGLDVNTNRTAVSDDKTPWHDVHARVRGPAAERFLGVFLWRLMASIDWGDQPVPAPEDTPGPPPNPSDYQAYGEGASDMRMRDEARHARQTDVHAMYQLWQNYKRSGSPFRRFTGANPVRMHAGVTIGNPQLATIRFPSEIGYMVRNAIAQSRSFIYVEDQYFWHHEMAQLLGNAVREGHIKQLVVVTNLSDGLAEHPPYTTLGLRHLAYAARGYTDRVLVFERVGTYGRYVHAKAFVYDDVSAHVGSANFNNRGYSHDSESAGVWVDRVAGHVPWHVVDTTIARKLRVKLWNKHLGIETRHLFDGLGAMKYWHELAEQTTPARLSVGNTMPTTHLVSVDGERWNVWARRQGGAEPPGDVDTGWDPREHADWVVDPP